jgi:hypothetical protein
VEDNQTIFELKIKKATNYTQDEFLKLELTGKSLTFNDDGKVPLSNYTLEENTELRGWLNDNLMLYKFNKSFETKKPITYEGRVSNGRIEIFEYGQKTLLCDLEFDSQNFKIRSQGIDYDLYISGNENYYGLAKGGWDSDDYVPLWVLSALKANEGNFYNLKFYRGGEFMSLNANLNLDKKIFIPFGEHQ